MENRRGKDVPLKHYHIKIHKVVTSACSLSSNPFQAKWSFLEINKTMCRAEEKSSFVTTIKSTEVVSSNEIKEFCYGFSK